MDEIAPQIDADAPRCGWGDKCCGGDPRGCLQPSAPQEDQPCCYRHPGFMCPRKCQEELAADQCIHEPRLSGELF
jgi:hypothetical protein